MSPAPRLVGLPLSRWLGVRDQARRLVKPNATLEKHFLMEGWRPKEVRAPATLLHPHLPAWLLCGWGLRVVCGPLVGGREDPEQSLAPLQCSHPPLTQDPHQ